MSLSNLLIILLHYFLLSLSHEEMLEHLDHVWSSLPLINGRSKKQQHALCTYDFSVSPSLYFLYLHVSPAFLWHMFIHLPPPSDSLPFPFYNPFLSRLLQPVIKCNLSWGGSDVQRASQEVRLLFKALTSTRRALIALRKKITPTERVRRRCTHLRKSTF